MNKLLGTSQKATFLRQVVNSSLFGGASLPIRGIKLHEYQAGRLLNKYKVPIPLGNVAFNGKEAYLVAK